MARVVVVGGGISGLTTAHALRARGADVVVYEATAKVGGNVRTLEKQGFLIDEGPDSWVVTKPFATQLAKELGLGHRLIETIPENRKVYVRTRRGLVLLPEGMMLGIPTRIWPLVTTSLISWRGKLRAGLDLVLPIAPAREDEALGDFVERRLGREVLENLAGPLLGGLFTGDPRTLSLRGTFPQLADLEKEGGLIRGALKQARKRTSSEKPSAFTTLRGGVGELISTLAERVGSSLVRETRVARITKEGDRFRIERDGAVEHADHVVLAGPAHSSAVLAQGVSAELGAELAAIPYGSSCTVFVAYERHQIDHPLDATGYLVPSQFRDRAMASTWVSSKWPHRAPQGTALLRVFFGAEEVDKSEGELVELARRELRATLRIEAEPLLTHVGRFRKASPQPQVGHPAKLRRMKSLCDSIGGLHIAGSAYDGVGLGDCVRQAQAIAAKIA
ncbi:MAG: protoporphyrinogen oxidase [Polyangiales bacterium]